MIFVDIIMFQGVEDCDNLFVIFENKEWYFFGYYECCLLYGIGYFVLCEVLDVFVEVICVIVGW